ncbi:MAG TPA: hypothetical protein VGH63_11955, partial [Polyangia bacterium]
MLVLVLLAATVSSPARAGDDTKPSSPLAVGPYVQDVRADGFTVVFDTAADVAAEVRAGAVRVATRGTHHEAVVRGLPAATRAHYAVFV